MSRGGPRPRFDSTERSKQNPETEIPSGMLLRIRKQVWEKQQPLKMNASHMQHYQLHSQLTLLGRSHMLNAKVAARSAIAP
jgi:hypothetical protein